MRTFCLHCGEPTPCACNVPAETLRALEKREQEHWSEYTKASDLTPADLHRQVVVGGHPQTVHELIRTFDHPPAVFRESAMKATDRGVLQLVYQRYQGTQLVEWPWA